MTEVVKAGSASNSSVQSTPTPPSSGQSVRSRRSARKCATPIKSAEKVDKDERVSLHQLSLTDTSSTNTTITPDSSNLTKVQAKVGRVNTARNVYMYVYVVNIDVHVEIADLTSLKFADSASLSTAILLVYMILMIVVCKKRRQLLYMCVSKQLCRGWPMCYVHYF